MIKKILSNYWPIIVLFFLTFIPFIISTNADYNFFFGFEKFDLTNLFSTWVKKDLGTIPGYFAPIYYLYLLFVKLMGHKIGTILIWLVQYDIGFISIIFIVKEFSKIYGFNSNRRTEFLVGLFYLFSIPGIFLPLMPFTFSMPYAFFPLLVYILLKFINGDQKNILLYSVLFTLVLFLALGMQIVFLLFLGLGLLFIFINFIIIKKIPIKTSLIFCLLTSLFYAIISFPFYYTTLYLPVFTQQSLVNESLTIETLQFTQSNSWLSEIYKIMGMTSYYYQFNDKYSIPSAVPFFKDPISIFAVYSGAICFMIFILLSLIHRRKTLAMFSIVFFLTTTFFMAGQNGPAILQNIYLFLYDHFFLFKVFRNSYKAYFLLLFLYSIGLSFLSLYISKYYSRFSNYFFLFVTIVLMISARSLYTPDFYSFLDVRLPDAVEQSIAYVNQDLRNERILVMPIVPFPSYTFSDNGLDPYELISNMNVITNVNSAGGLSGLLDEVNRAVDSRNKKKLDTRFKELGIDYLMWNKYINVDSKQRDNSSKQLSFFQRNYRQIRNINDKIIFFQLY